MKKVYIVKGSFDYEGDTVIKVFKSKEDANNYIKKYKKLTKKKEHQNGPGYLPNYDDYSVEEFEVF